MAAQEPRTAPVASAMQLVGTIAIIGGGLVAAVTSPLQLEKGSWAAAYLVLVAGVAQYAMGQARYIEPNRGARGGWAQLTLWVAGNLGVLGGTLIGASPVVLGASVLLIIALIIGFVATFGGDPPRKPGTLLLYRAMCIVLAASIPVGIVLSVIRNA